MILLQAMMGLGLLLFFLAGVLVLLLSLWVHQRTVPGNGRTARRLLWAIIITAALMILFILLNTGGDAVLIN